ncbi:phosphonate metabolism protein/1,5-bisphosphokinase (PRPP-forming) PhnN [Pseudomonas sp. CNPSo 3701]|uniref:phosphonate metabolism protein/1,5-bisphosphokinase (PRPP-forming) PhnN n=1 Tax=Pseudomonas sp. CNPSo 3701 TaxID=3027943 RepID=UPI00236405B5|nr:phosphonate metabolism protein/1,5-bisphosphokinase (PRPP-forming) PhnN [Pseudomonas sp. CNPSo 3701]MDD1509907.1 phosphonate metabolism protein/1,5-bisphosphokinase (PRPP-forming) PhnN [Pseudomonas sp. CNPSo 3701]
MNAGRLIYLMGPSGAGKDSVLQHLKQCLEGSRCRIARRVITRSAEAMGEEAISVSPREFGERERVGDFAMVWRANGLAYGIPREIEEWLADGYQVIVNGSRGYLDEARSNYPDLLAVLLQVEPAILRKRLLARAREDVDQIEARLARSAELSGSAFMEADQRIIRLDNSGSLDETVERLLQLIDSH